MAKSYKFSNSDAALEINFQEDCFIPNGYIISLGMRGIKDIPITRDELHSLRIALTEIEWMIPLRDCA